MKSAAYVFEAVGGIAYWSSLAEVADRQEMEGQEGTVAPIAVSNRGYGPVPASIRYPESALFRSLRV